MTPRQAAAVHQIPVEVTQKQTIDLLNFCISNKLQSPSDDHHRAGLGKAEGHTREAEAHIKPHTEQTEHMRAHAEDTSLVATCICLRFFAGVVERVTGGTISLHLQLRG
jgi:hypothetical protein